MHIIFAILTIGGAIIGCLLGYLFTSGSSDQLSTWASGGFLVGVVASAIFYAVNRKRIQ